MFLHNGKSLYRNGRPLSLSSIPVSFSRRIKRISFEGFVLATSQEEGVDTPNESGNGTSRSSSYKKNYTYEDWLREQAEEQANQARKAAGPNLAVSQMPAFASLEDVLRYFLYEESGLILDAGADKLESSLIVHNLESVAISKSLIALTTKKADGFSGEVIVSFYYFPPVQGECICEVRLLQGFGIFV